MGRPRISTRRDIARATADYCRSAASQQPSTWICAGSLLAGSLLSFGLSALAIFVSGMAALRLLQLLLEGFLDADHVLSGALATCCSLGVFSHVDWTLVCRKQPQILAPVLVIPHSIKSVRQRGRGKARQSRRVSRATRAHLIAQLQQVFAASLPKRYRAAPTTDALSIARCLASLPTEKLYAVFDSCWAQMRKRKDQISRVALLRLAAALVRGLDGWRMPERVYVRCVGGGEAATLRVLEEAALRMATRQAAFALLDTLVHKQWRAEDRPRVLDACIDAIAYHYKDGQSYGIALRANVTRSMDEAVGRDDATVGKVLDDAHTIRFIFDGISSGDNRLSRAATHLLQFVLSYATHAERITLVVRHFDALRKAFCTMSLFELAEYIHCEEVGGIVLGEPSLLHAIARALGQHHARQWDNEQVCRLAILLLNYAMHSGTGHLEYCLGLGYLKAARFFALDVADGNGLYIEPILARMIRRAPAWTAKFKAMTEGGPDNNSVADLGRRIRMRAARPSATYVLN